MSDFISREAAETYQRKVMIAAGCTVDQIESVLYCLRALPPAQEAAPAVKVQARDFIQDARSWPVLTQKYMRRWPDSKKTQHWSGKAVHIETENGVWRKGGNGYTYAGAPDAGIWTFEDAVSRIAHCGPEKRGAFILVPVDYLAALEGAE